MSTLKPEKITGKKFVRGKPYYKVKWEGLPKDQVTWESPAHLNQFKSMINKYEIKNWGFALEDKFFDPQLYTTKAFAHRVKPLDKKKIKSNKKAQKQKLQQAQSQESEAQLSEENNVKCCKIKLENNSLAQKSQLNLSNSEIGKIFVEKQAELSSVPITQPLKELVSNDSCVTNKKQKDDVNEVKNNIQKDVSVNQDQEIHEADKNDEMQPKNLEKREKQSEVKTNSKKAPVKDLGLTLSEPQKQQNKQVGEPPQHQNTKTLQIKEKKDNSFGIENFLNIQINAKQSIKHIAHIYHLQKMSKGNHLYLVEFQNKQIKKLTTEEMMQDHPQELVSYLEGRYKAKRAF